MKKITALLLALLLALSLCTMGAAADETITIVLEPADDTLLTAEGLALFFVDRAAVKEETETSVSWYKETTANGKTERELIEEMPLVIRPGKGRSATRIYVADGYEPTQELIDAVEKYAPEKDPDSEHVYRWHRVFNQDCSWRGLRYGTATTAALSSISPAARTPMRTIHAPFAAGRPRKSTSTPLTPGLLWTTACTMGASVPAAIRKWASTTWKQKGFSTPTKLSSLNAALFAELNIVVKWRKYALHISVPGFPGTDFLCVYIRGGVW